MNRSELHRHPGLSARRPAAIRFLLAAWCLRPQDNHTANLTLDTGPEPPRLLRFARNDTAKGCHCEERSDEAISTRASMTGVICLVPGLLGCFVGE
jgi:hypothetical protein